MVPSHPYTYYSGRTIWPFCLSLYARDRRNYFYSDNDTFPDIEMPDGSYGGLYKGFSIPFSNDGALPKIKFEVRNIPDNVFSIRTPSEVGPKGSCVFFDVPGSVDEGEENWKHAVVGNHEIGGFPAPGGASDFDDPGSPLTLESALSRAKSGALSVLLAESRAQEAQGRADVLAASKYPKLRLGLGRSNYEGLAQATEGVFLDVKRRSAAAGLGLILAYRPGEAVFRFAAASARAQAAESRTQAARHLRVASSCALKICAQPICANRSRRRKASSS